MEFYARLAWAHDYRPIFKVAAELNNAESVMLHHQSDYRRRQIGAGGEVAEEAHLRALLRVSSDVERLACRHGECYPLS